MRAIQAPVDAGQSGPEVGNLQDALSLFLSRGVIKELESPNIPSAEELADLGAKLAEERASSFYGPATRRLVQIIQIQQGLGDNLGGAIEETTARLMNRMLKKLDALDGDDAYEVHGTVTLASGAVAVGYVVRAADRDVRSRQHLGIDAVTDSSGGYQISYPVAEFAAADGGGPDLVVGVFAAGAGIDDEALVESPTAFNAEADTEINLQVPDATLPRSDFEVQVGVIVPLLVGQAPDGTALPIAALTDSDVDFLAADTGIERQHIAWLATAFGYSRRTAGRIIWGHIPQAEGRVAAAFFYGWFREGLPDAWDALVELPIGVLRAAALTAIGNGTIPASLADSLESALAAMPNPRRDALRAAVAGAGLRDGVANIVVQRAGDITLASNALLSGLVDDGLLENADAHRVGLGLATHTLVDGDAATMAAIVGATSAKLPAGLQRARDLAALDVPDIERALDGAGVDPPAGETRAKYATALAGQIAALFPTDAMLHRATSITDDVVREVREAVDDGDGRPARSALTAFVNAHPGLDLGGVIDEATDADAAVETLRERVGWLDKVRELNPDLDLLAIDYLPDSASLRQVDFGGLPDDAQTMVIADLKPYQRIQSLGVGALDGIAILHAGVGSGFALALRGSAEIAEQTGIPIHQARRYVQQAEYRADETALTWFAIYSLERDTQVTQQRSLLPPPEYLKKLTGYNELFGSADFCNCENCRSVLGPAAYFVDLMYWVERHILSDSFKDVGGEDNDLHLGSRRSDLWTLELTCGNTNRIVPSLDLVIAMLEQFIVKQKGLASVDALYDRLATVDHSIGLPFSMPVERMSFLLAHLGISRAEIAETFLVRSADAGARARARLGMVSKEFDIITNSRLGDLSAAAITAAETFYSSWLGASLTLSTIPGQTETRALDPVSILSFARASGSDLAGVREILTSSFVNGTAPGAPPRIQLEAGIGAAGGVQNDTERVLNLTSGRVDRFERMVRLWRHLGWTLTELDYTLVRLQLTSQAASNQLDGPMLSRLAQLVGIQDALHLPVDELCALWDSVPIGALRAETSLFDRAFNLPSLIRQGRWPAHDQMFDDSAAARARLVAALQVTDADLTGLLSGLAGCLTAGSQASESFELGERNLSVLYRYARLARALKLSIQEVLDTVALTDAVAAKQPATERCILTLDDLQAVLYVHQWRITSGFSLPEIHFITGSADTLDGYDPPDDVAASLAREIVAERSLEIAPDLFTQIGLTQDQSTEIVEANMQASGAGQALLEVVPGTDAYRIVPTIGLSDVGTALVFDPEVPPSMVADFARDLYAIVKRAGAAGFEPSELKALGLSRQQSVALLQANVSLGAADRRPFELVTGTTTHYRLRVAVDEDAAVAAFGAGQEDARAVKARLLSRAIDLLTRHHAAAALAAKASTAIKVSPEKTLALLDLVMASAPAHRSALVDALQGGPLQPLGDVLDALMRYSVLFRNATYDPAALAFVRANPTPWALSDPPSSETVRRVSLYAKLAARPDPAYQPTAPKPDTEALRSVVSMSGSIATAPGDQTKMATIAAALRSDGAQLSGVLPWIALAEGNSVAPRLDELSQLADALTLTRRLGVSAELLRLAVSDVTSELAEAADGVFAAVRAKYPDEKAFNEKLEPFTDKLRSRNRDGLVAYLLSAPDEQSTSWRRRFITASDLSHYFLTDVMVEGCARTSKVVAAISTVQLYAQRVLMNLEQSDETPPTVVARLDDPKRLQAEWSWRKNYQVWVANRKVFLYPENYIEPGLRDDKTPLFKELEDVLLQQPITEQNALDAYATYLHGFDEVARLRIAGAYHDWSDPKRDVLHLFGVTATEPPVYYYRAISGLQPPASAPKQPTSPVFSPWKKLNLQISARRVSPVVLHGRLYLFWVETTTRQKSDFDKGSSTFSGYRHSVRTRFSYLRLDERWTPPQQLKVADSAGDFHDTRLIDDYAVKDPRLQDGFDESGRFIKTYDPNPTGGTAVELGRFAIDHEGGSLKPVRWAQWDSLRRHHTVPIETYVPGGWKWDRVYPGVIGLGEDARIALEFAPRNDQGPPSPELVDLWSARLLPAPAGGGQGYDSYMTIGVLEDSGVQLYQAVQPRARASNVGLPFLAATSWLNDETIIGPEAVISAFGPFVQLPARSELQIVNGNLSSVVMEPTGESLLLLSTSNDPHFELWSLGTSLAQALSARLTASRIDGLLSIDFQESHAMQERPSAASIVSTQGEVVARGFSTVAAPASWTGPDAALRGYFREIFFQIPFLIADHLNSQQRFADAQRWYHYLFDPTASESGVAETKRPWRYREFREQGIKSLREALTDANALAAYRADPFNPDAIARLRPGAYQKSIFMKYIDNLLDWGDSLYSQFTMESVNEATMLYTMAADLLGPRPVELGPCGESTEKPRTYADIAPLLRPADPNKPDTKDILIEELETLRLAPGNAYLGDVFVQHIAPAELARSAAQSVARRTLMVAESFATPSGDGSPPSGPTNAAGWNTPGAQTWKDAIRTPLRQVASQGSLGGTIEPQIGGQDAAFVLSGDPVEQPLRSIPDNIESILGGRLGAPKGLDRGDYVPDVRYGLDDAPPAHQPPTSGVAPQPKPFELMRARLVFCIPENKELRGYWDRVDDRLTKIRNCMDIAGVRRKLELFAPEIDPRMLVRMRAAGLSLDDVMNVTSGNLPPYRFAYLIDKAKQHAGLVQQFGSQLLNALQQRDGEELTRLRTVHEQNLLKLRSQTVQAEIDAAIDTLESLNRQRDAAEYRRDYFAALSSAGLNAWERIQQVSTHVSGSSLEAASIIQLLSVGLTLLPNIGAPTSMNFGGKQVGNSAFYAAGVLKMIAEAAELAGKSAGIEATFQRREQEWKHQVELAKRELDQLAKQITAAEIRRDIAVQSQLVHERSIDQTQEIFDFLRDRFTGIGLFTWMSAQLQKMHRMAFNAALSMARLAEQACQFEHSNVAVRPSLTGDYWDAGKAGLLAGDRLMLDLQNLERSYIETNYRTLEIEQSFSLARFNPDALSQLKTGNSGTFQIPEWFFDLTYPKHFRRRIKAVRLTIPCVVGPHTNVGATLRLLDSHIRTEPSIDSRLSVPLRHTTAIAVSMAQSDAGVFDFSFRDERYMPFEGAGVDTTWQLELPHLVKPFDYGTISDVILRISYTAEEDTSGALDEAQQGTSGLLSTLTDPGIPRILSLRTDFPTAWNALLAGNTTATIDIEERYVPFFMSTFDLAQVSIDVLVGALAGEKPEYPTVTFDDAATTIPQAEDASGLHSLGTSTPVDYIARHILTITDWGSASKTDTADGPKRLDDSQISDIWLRVMLKRKKQQA